MQRRLGNGGQETETKSEGKKSELNIDIVGLEEDKKKRLKGLLGFFSGDRNNIKVIIKSETNDNIVTSIHFTDAVLKEFVELLGEDRVTV